MLLYTQEDANRVRILGIMVFLKRKILLKQINEFSLAIAICKIVRQECVATTDQATELLKKNFLS